ncbi:hypothetical protein F5Y16DRAFT_335800 [Xylariaceae sp. FL0255]|nr:hypothetical protein F5Y16DRAFT_335800 [Xylariaceae sp. FL0255]
MAIDQAIANGAQFVARVVEYQVRQISSTTMNTMSTSTVPSPTSTVPPPPNTVMSTTSSASPTSSDTSNGSGKGSSSSSPLLFFVALGFGVVFTNLWIIVGVKYCFRYNARNRAMARLDENGDPIDLQNMHPRPHRRRREKKLMTMEEVNEKFPMMKYKTWVLERQKEGLPSAGGISSTPASRANSVRSVEGVVPQHEPEEPTDSQRVADHEEITDANATSPTAAATTTKDKVSETSVAAVSGEVSTTDTTAAPMPTEVPMPKPIRRSSEEDEDDDDHIDAALPPEMLNSSGDTCAICIDTLENDDDIRGLTCGHAFHAVCLDPWLTNRRACCPLCKADYYTPKVRPQPTEAEGQDLAAAEAADPANNNGRMNMPRAPARSFAWSHFRDAPRQMFPTRLVASGLANDPGSGGRQNRPARASRREAAPQNHNPNSQETASAEEGGNVFSRFRNRFPPFRLDREMRRSREAGQSASAAETTTPSQLEAAVRTPIN